MKIELLFLGKTRASHLAAGIEEYRKRLSHYVKVELKTLKDRLGKSGLPDAQAVTEEGKILLAAASNPTLLIALDRTGSRMGSEQLAAAITSLEDKAVKCLTFVIGGPAGLAPEVLDRAALVLSLSEMTFPHELVRLMLLEQLYRAYTIKAGERYHR